jgi:NADPH:quinone reductase-like Zn-dependent oxidoreductase
VGGGVGGAIVQLCRTVEGVTIIGTAARAKHEQVLANGCHHVLDSRGGDYVHAVRELTGGKGVDLVLDPCGGREWRRGYELLRPEGMLIAYGFSKAVSGDRVNWLKLGFEFLRVPRFSPFALLGEGRAVAGFNLGAFWEDMGRTTAELNQLFAWFEAGAVRPHVHEQFPLADAAGAHRCLQERRNVGKVLLAA